ncbi:MAG: hypothetical protein M3H12_18715 [Chromatiales bacterium]|nr:hypothetical protein [Gammaproteobacteria bacterium]
MQVDLLWVLGIFGSSMALLVGGFWRHLDKRFDRIEIQREEDLKEIEKHKEANNKAVADLRIEVYDKFARVKDLHDWKDEMKGDIARMGDRVEATLDRMFLKIGALAKDLNQVIGRVKQKE